MKMLQKIIDCESLENFKEIAHDAVYFGNVASLPLTNQSNG